MVGDGTDSSSSSDTRSLSHEAVWAASPSAIAEQLVPRLRLLYHCDPDRFGWLSVPDAVPLDGRWATVGRVAPLFAPPSARRQALPLEDPSISREQLRLRWIAHLRRFEVEPVATARRRLQRVDFVEGASSLQPVTSATIVPPGTCLAIGDRVLISLELAHVRSPEADRMGLVGESEVLWALREEIRAVARFGKAALLTGPTGVGKELAARAIHEQGPRPAGPFFAVNCAALPDRLVESALFGHRKGAFTGAESDHKGYFRAADGGTLLLDEFTELPLAVQAKLLRVLQDGVVVPVGDHEGRKVDVRIVAASNRELEAQVRAGAFREDLYYRIAAHVLRVPPLAARRFDVPELFSHLLGRARERHPGLEWLWSSGLQWRPALTFAFMLDILRRDFGGNVRELENFVERIACQNLVPGAFRRPVWHDVSGDPEPMVLEGATGDTEHPSSPEALLRLGGEALSLAPRTLEKLLGPAVLVQLQERATRAGSSDAEQRSQLRASATTAVFDLLRKQDFNQSTVAAALGVSRSTLIKLMGKLGLPRATDLGPGEIAQAQAEAGGDLDAAAGLLRVSPRALKQRLTELSLKAHARRRREPDA